MNHKAQSERTDENERLLITEKIRKQMNAYSESCNNRKQQAQPPEQGETAKPTQAEFVKAQRKLGYDYDSGLTPAKPSGKHSALPTVEITVWRGMAEPTSIPYGINVRMTDRDTGEIETYESTQGMDIERNASQGVPIIRNHADKLAEALAGLHACHRAFSSNDNWTLIDDDAREQAEQALADYEQATSS